MKQWIQDFKNFAIKGNAVDMAVGIVIGAAFGKVVSTLVSAIISPLISLLTGGFDFSAMKIILRHAEKSLTGNIVKPEIAVGFGELIQVCLDFIIVAFAIFWVIRLISKLNKPKPETPAAPAPDPADVVILKEIRDILNNKNSK